MRMRWLALGFLAIFLASPSYAKITFAPLPPETPFTSKIGTGGTVTTTAGVDFWTRGTPPRPYRLLGFLLGKSEAELLKAVGTAGLSRQVKDAGGDALLVSAVADLPVQARVAISSFPGAPKYQFWVIKYLAAGSYAVADDDHAKQLAEMKSWTEEQCANPNSMTSMTNLTREQRRAARAETRKMIERIAEAMKGEPESARRRNDELQQLTMQMLDCQEQRQVAQATEAAIRGGVGTEVSWTSATRAAVSGRSIASAQQTLSDGTHCITVTDVIIIEGEETMSPKRMCRSAGQSAYRRA